VMARHAQLGMAGLADASRAPKTHPNQSPPEVEGAILRVRKAHPTWGSKKILATLDREQPDECWPARSTIDAILQRAGVVEPRGVRRRRQPSAPPVVEANAPNDVWSMDYKGWFRVGDGTRCDPLTVNDVFSRASLTCQAMVSPKSEDVRRRL
jgi:putative transposase